MTNPIKRFNCLIDTIWYTAERFFKTGEIIPVMGHVYTKHEVHRNCCVEISYCGDCGHVSMSWHKEGLETDKMLMETVGILEGTVDATESYKKDKKEGRA